MQSLRKLAVFIKPYRLLAILAPLLMMLEVAMDLMQPRLMETIIDVGIRQMDLSIVMNTGLLMIGVALVGAFGGIANTVAAVHVSQNFGADLRNTLFRKIQDFSFGNLDALNTGQLVTRLTNDVNQLVQVILTMLRIMVRAPLILLGSLVLAVVTSPGLALLFVVLLPIVTAVLVVVTRKAYPMFMRVQEGLDRLNTVLQENLAGVRVVKAFVRAQHEEQRFEDANENLLNRTMTALQLLVLVMPALTLIINLGLVAALWFGGQMVMLGSLQAGQLIAFTNYLLRALGSLMMVGMMLAQLSRAQASGERVIEVLESKPELQDPPAASLDWKPKGRVVFDNVSFGYKAKDQLVLRNISFTAEPGQSVAVLGATGSGKSSLIHLIPRFYDVTGGRILIDGIDVRHLPQGELRKVMGIALQEVILFTGSVRDNIRYGRPDASDAEVEAAARAAQAHEFIQSLPQGYDTQLGQRGVNLSGGQKQRIAIARALVVDPIVLILDDSTSSVDAETEAKIQAVLDQLMRGRTSFIIAQRISTVLKADQILVLDQGRLVSRGTHQELMENSPIYREIYQSQLGDVVPVFATAS
jgi:ATP-binding cassette subfamily B protein